MANFDNIIQEIETNLPDNNTQAITAKKLRDTLKDLTDAIETQQNNFEGEVDELFDNLSDDIQQQQDAVDETVATFDGRVTENTQSITGAEAVLQNTTYYENIIDYNPTFGGVNANTGEVISSSTAKIAIIKIEDWADQIIYRSLITASISNVYGGAFYTAATPEEIGTSTFLSGVLYNRERVAGSEIRTIDIPEGATYFATGCQTTNTLLNKDNFFILQTTKTLYSQDITNNTHIQYGGVGILASTHVRTSISGNNWAFLMMYEINNTYKNITISGYMPSDAYEGITCWSAPDPTNAENYLGNMDDGITKSRAFNDVTIKYSDLPKGTKYIIVHQGSSSTRRFVVSGPQMPVINNIITATSTTQVPVAGEDIKKNLLSLTPDSMDKYTMLFSDGTTPNADYYTKNPYVVTYNNIDPTLDYYACGVSSRFYDSTTQSTAKMVMVAYYDENNEVIATEKATETITQTGTDAVVDYKLHVPPQTTTIKVYGDATQLPCLKLFNNNSDAKKYDAIIAPQIHNNLIYRRELSTPLKMLCVGSSWFMNTWWYTNKLIASAGINAEIHAYYMGSSEFKEWVQLYNNDLTPITSTRGCRRHVSVNGANWTINVKGSNDYTEQNFRDDFYADMTAGDWDLIVIQQGAKTCQCWADWQYYKDWLYIIKQNCNPDTVIGFNSTWTPALGHRYLTDNQPNTYEGQNEWQRINYDHTQKFMKLSGIDLVIPNGALLRILRASSDINIAEQNDLANDHLHLNNGLPEYAAAGNFFQTLIAPMYGVDFDTVEWVPTTSTQKSAVSGTSYYPMTDEQRTLVRKAIKMSQADRFGFRTFE